MGLTIPYVSKRLRTTLPSGRRTTLSAQGLGDVPVVAKWRFFKDQDKAQTTEAAALFGLELPTGRDDVRDAGMRLAAPLQPGSGSIDAILGGAFTHLWDGGRWLLNADLIYKANSAANDYRFGNVLRFDVGGQWRVYPTRYESHDQFTLNLILEANGRYLEKDTINGQRVHSTGGTTVFCSPGVQAIFNTRWLGELGVQIPVYRHLNGVQLGEDVRIALGLRWLF